MNLLSAERVPTRLTLVLRYEGFFLTNFLTMLYYKSKSYEAWVIINKLQPSSHIG